MNGFVYGDYPDLSKVKKVLVIVLKNIGDVVLSSPVFSVLKRHIPGCEVDALVNGGTEEMLTLNPDIRTIHVLNRKGLKGFIPRLKEEARLVRAVRKAGYDMTIALSTGDRSRNMSFFSGAKIRVGVEPAKARIRVYTTHVNMAPARRHYMERNLDCLRRIGIFPEGSMKKTVFFEGEGDHIRVEKLLSRAGVGPDAPYMVVHPTSRWMFKCWSCEKVAGLIDRVQRELDIRVVLTAGPDKVEKAYTGLLQKSLSTEIIDFSGILSLKELGALIRGARLFFGVDSAPMHISAAVNTPVIALFGPTSASDWGPRGEGHRVITSPGHSCVPCGRDGCGGSKMSDCLTDIDISTVFQAVKEQLAK